MKRLLFILFLSVPVLELAAQPVWSPVVRSKREIKWLQDSLHITEAQTSKLKDVSLHYQEQMDQAAQKKNKDVLQARLMREKDATFKKVLDKEQYTYYYRHESLLRKQAKIIYKGHQPL